MKQLLPVSAVLGLLALGPARTVQVQAAPVRTDHVEAELVAESSTVPSGSSIWVGVRLKMDPHWHTYWRYAGDAGLPTTIHWQLPEGFSAGPIQWPYPERIVVSDLVNLGYEDEVLLLSEITASADAKPGEEVTLTARVDWLVCQEACTPGNATVSTTVKVSNEAPQPLPEWADDFAATRKRLPITDAGWQIRAFQDGRQLYLDLTPPPGFNDVVEKASLYPHDFGLITLTPPSSWRKQGDGYRLVASLEPNAEQIPASVQGTLVASRGWDQEGAHRALDISVPLQAAAVATGEASRSRPWHWLIAFLGGLILNLMPCVFPVLGLKVMSFVKQAGEDPARVKLHGLVFSLGVLISFWVLSGLLIALRAGGEELGWGFQLQSPGFVFGLTALLLVFALNLSGLFEVGLGLTSAGGDLGQKSGLAGSFFSGVLATVVATPCAAPFLAPAIGIALTLSPLDSILVFTFIALGLAFPYILLCLFPHLMRRLPKPGAWMDTFRQVMAFPLYATVAYLVWVLAGQVDEKKFLHALFALTMIAMAAWVYGRWGSFQREARVRRRGHVVAMLMVIAAAAVYLGRSGASAVTWEPWSPERVEALRRDGRPVYIDFTARWCATCQVNKRVFNADEVVRRLRELDVVTLKADWTTKDPAITRALAEYGRSAVPFNLYFPPGADQPVQMPELLSRDAVLDALGGED